MHLFELLWRESIKLRLLCGRIFFTDLVLGTVKVFTTGDVGGGREVCKSNFSNGFTDTIKDRFLTNQGARSTVEPA